MKPTGYQNLITRPKRPKYLRALRETGKRGYVVVTCSLLALVIAFLSWVIPSPPLKGFFQWAFIILAVLIGGVLVVSTIIYIVRFLRYISKLEKKIMRIRSIFLAYSGVEDAEPWGEIAYSVDGIADEQGTVNLVIDLSSDTSINPGAILDVVVNATGDVWGTVKVKRVAEQRAWAVPIDRKNPDFWETLEDRMKSNPSAPDGVHLEPFLPAEVRGLLLLDNKERKGV